MTDPMKITQPTFQRIIVVDDDPASLFLIELILEEANVNGSIHTFDRATKALQFIQAHCINAQAAAEECPDLILLDLNMPIMDGFEFLEALQELGLRHTIQATVVVLTSSAHRQDQDKAASYHVRSFLTKPLTVEKIKPLIGYN